MPPLSQVGALGDSLRVLTIIRNRGGFVGIGTPLHRWFRCLRLQGLIGDWLVNEAVFRLGRAKKAQFWSVVPTEAGAIVNV